MRRCGYALAGDSIMAVKNGEVADLFDLLASLSELDGAIVHKVIA